MNSEREKVIQAAKVRLETSQMPGGRQVYIADDESLIRRLVDELERAGAAEERAVEVLHQARAEADELNGQGYPVGVLLRILGGTMIGAASSTESASGEEPIRVTVSDPQTGEELERRDLENDYMLICAGNRYLDSVQRHGNGTHVLTVKTAAAEGNS